MNPVSPYPALLALVAALATSHFVAMTYGATLDKVRFASIDGLRGYLAFFVFMHHSCIWQNYARTGLWSGPSSAFYARCGETSVLLFFMITGFLFLYKLGTSKPGTLDWGRFFVARFLRIMPLYCFAVTLMILIVASKSDAIEDTFGRIILDSATWYGLSLFGEPDINQYQKTPVICARIYWTLRYELAFYLAMPLLSIGFLSIPPVKWLLFSVVSMVVMYFLSLWEPHSRFILPFLSGGIASLFARNDAFRRFSSGRLASIVVLICGAVATGAYSSPHGVVPLFLLSVAFGLVACGNDLGGVLSCSAARTLGDISYGVYLLHGIVLFVLFECILAPAQSREMSSPAYWTLIICITPCLVMICFAAHGLIERPWMRRTDVIMAWIGRRKMCEVHSEPRP